MIDQNRDGFIDKEDLKDMMASLGEAPFAVRDPEVVSFLTFLCQDGNIRSSTSMR